MAAGRGTGAPTGWLEDIVAQAVPTPHLEIPLTISAETAHEKRTAKTRCA